MIWLGDAAKLDAGAIGLLFGCKAIIAMLLQPLFGVLTDRLDNRKHLIWCIVTLLTLLAPYMQWVFMPLLMENLVVGVLAGGLYLGIIFAAGAGTLEAYLEKACRAGDITYGRVRMFGAIGYGSSAALSGMLVSENPETIFWIGSGCALVLALLFSRVQPGSTVAQTDDLQEKPAPISYAAVKDLVSDRRFWSLVLYVVGVACLYDVFDQQFANFFRSFFASPQQGTQVFGFVTTLTEGGVALMMFCIPWVLTRIGGKNALIVAGIVMSMRILGSAFASSPTEVVALKMLHALEVPLIFVGMFKYIEDVFDTRLSATIYMMGFIFAKGIGVSLISPGRACVRGFRLQGGLPAAGQPGPAVHPRFDLQSRPGPAQTRPGAGHARERPCRDRRPGAVPIAGIEVATTRPHDATGRLEGDIQRTGWPAHAPSRITRDASRG
ncbi:oligosaccharide MFS transporter [Azotobacter sp. CWF10]